MPFMKLDLEGELSSIPSLAPDVHPAARDNRAIIQELHDTGTLGSPHRERLVMDVSRIVSTLSRFFLDSHGKR